MPNGLAPLLLFLFCYLSRPVVWGESARGPTPTGGNWLGGGARSAGVSVGVWGSRQNWVRVPVQLGEMRPGVLCYLEVVGAFWGEGRTEQTDRPGFAEDVWDLVPPTRLGSC